MTEQEKSVRWIVIAVMIGIALFGWGFLAGSYAGEHTPKLSQMTPEQLKELRT